MTQNGKAGMRIFWGIDFIGIIRVLPISIPGGWKCGIAREPPPRSACGASAFEKPQQMSNWSRAGDQQHWSQA